MTWRSPNSALISPTGGTTMTDGATVSVDTLKAIAAAFNAHDLDAIMEFFAEDREDSG